MTNISPAEIKSFVNKLVDNSGANIRKHFRNLDKIETKDDKSPVTIADQQSEQIMRTLINKSFPEHGIQGEEFGIENKSAEYRWIIDPIDGTLSFTIGRPTFGTLVGLLHNNEPIAGIIDQPINNERWIAIKGNGCTFNGKKTKVRSCDSLANATIATTGPNYFNTKGLSKFNKVSDAAKHTVYGGDCYLYALIASGFLDLAIDSCLKAHDFLPIIPIIEEAGGIITDWHGKELNEKSSGDVIVAGDERVHAEAVKILG